MRGRAAARDRGVTARRANGRVAFAYVQAGNG